MREEVQRLRVLTHRADDVFRETVRVGRMDLQRHVDLGPDERREVLDHLLSEPGDVAVEPLGVKARAAVKPALENNCGRGSRACRLPISQVNRLAGGKAGMLHAGRYRRVSVRLTQGDLRLHEEGCPRNRVESSSNRPAADQAQVAPGTVIKPLGDREALALPEQLARTISDGSFEHRAISQPGQVEVAG